MTRPGNGRLAMITAARVLYRGGTEGAIRRRLLEENLLDTVILLPPNALPQASVDMVVCLFDRSREAGGARAHARDVLLVDARVGISTNKQLCLLTASEIDQIIADVNARQTQGQRCYLASREEIAANDDDLSFPRYVGAHKHAAVRDLAQEEQEIANLEHTLLGLQNQMAQQMAALVAATNGGQARSSL
jgi:type I restriction enzyme M protein